ncbi:hypothetical protein ZIOFF_072226 [Zingiber officinale]|uniref:Neprosin PEP catalytic domain-containing protein n=1 Tax=Zingiber officinale TaxID=94328 RepID=A0A8J5C9T6_ZINOF|nr:hypothetical protein ZIOFF_072226 [Zingiber officinale]
MQALSGPFYGAYAKMTTHKLPDLQPDQSSSSAIYLYGDTDVPGNEVNVIQVGWHDSNTGNWWVTYNDQLPLGYFPKELLPKMDHYASAIQMGGRVYSHLNVPSPPMGSGHPIKEGRTKTASFIQVQFVDQMNNLYGLNPDFIDPEADIEDYYSVGGYRYVDDKDKCIFNYGGAGVGIRAMSEISSETTTIPTTMVKPSETYNTIPTLIQFRSLASDKMVTTYSGSRNTITGDLFDCVDMYKQPAFDHPLLKNHTLQDSNTGNWWVTYNDQLPLGYFPKELLPKMDDYASAIQMGGRVYSHLNVPSPPMGSGHPIKEGRTKTASFIQVQFVDQMNNLYGLNPDFIDPEADIEDYYSVGGYRYVDDKDKYIFNYGGPGGFKK